MTLQKVILMATVAIVSLGITFVHLPTGFMAVVATMCWFMWELG